MFISIASDCGRCDDVPQQADYRLRTICRLKAQVSGGTLTPRFGGVFLLNSFTTATHPFHDLSIIANVPDLHVRYRAQSFQNSAASTAEALS